MQGPASARISRWAISLTYSDSVLVIGALGATTPVGRSAAASAAAVRAGISGFAEHPYMVDGVGRPMCVAPMPWIDPERSLGDRIVDALVGAVEEALAPTRKAGNQVSVSLLINLPAVRPGMPKDLERIVTAGVSNRFPQAFERIAVASLGHAGCIAALRSASTALQAQPSGMCIVAGADSYLEPDMLEWLDHTDQLHGAGERNNAWGFVPGEAAGAVLLGGRAALDRLRLLPLGTVRSIGLGRETQLINSGTVCLGLGLTGAVRDALGALHRDERVTDVYCDLNGEPYRADEYAFLVTRTREHFLTPSDFVSPADCWGDVGAASVPLMITLACAAGQKGYARGDLSLVWASSVTGERGAVLVETATSLST